MYSNSVMSVRTGGFLAPPFEMRRGTRQGCPLSPLLFIMFINYILKNGPTGTTVPGVVGQDECNGGLYADDVLILCEDVGAAQEWCAHIQNWAEKWGMELGLAKCGVMIWTTDEGIREEFWRTTFTVPSGEIPKVKEYKYLGIVVDESLFDSRTDVVGVVSLEKSYGKKLADKGMKALGTLRPLLTDKDCPLRLKVALVNQLVVPLMTYGCEWIAFKNSNLKPIQDVIHVAARWIIGLSHSNKEVAGFTLATELGLPSIEVLAAGARIRLYDKARRDPREGAGGLKTWLATLVHAGRGWRGQKQTWVTYTDTYYAKKVGDDSRDGVYPDRDPRGVTAGRLKYADQENSYAGTGSTEDYGMPERLRLSRRIPRRRKRDKDAPLRHWAERGYMWDRMVKSSVYTSEYIQTMYEELLGRDAEGFLIANELAPEAEVMHQGGWYSRIPNLVQERDDQVDAEGVRRKCPRDETHRRMLLMDCTWEALMSAERSDSWKWYDRWEFGSSRGFLKRAISRPDLSRGIEWLIKIRTNCFPKVNKRYNAMKATKQTPQFRKGRCPLCDVKITEGWEWAHLLIKCTAETPTQARVAVLKRPLDYFAMALGHEWAIQPTEIRGAELGNIAGVSSEDFLEGGVTAIYLVGGVVAEAYNLLYHVGFGQGNVCCPDVGTFGWIPCAEFLQKVVPEYTSKLYTGGNEVLLDEGSELHSGRGVSVERDPVWLLGSEL